MTEPKQDLLERKLGALYDDDVVRARQDLAARPLSTPAHARTDVSFGPLLAAVLVIGALAVIAPRLAGTEGSGTGPSSVPATPTSPTGVVGLPVRVGTTVVLRPVDAQVALGQTTAPVRLLVSGWLHADTPISCPLLAGDWNPCRALPVYWAPVGGQAMFVYGLAALGPLALPASGSVQGIVLRVHNLDGTCKDASCASLAVADDVVWLGAAEPAAGPAASRPDSSADAATAVASARTLLPDAGWALLSSSSGPYGQFVATPGDIAADRWVWVVTFEPGEGAVCATGAESIQVCPPGTRANVFVDFVDGMPIEADITSGPVAS
jgi:hypothetical protein